MEFKTLEEALNHLLSPLEKLYLSNSTGYTVALGALLLIGISYAFFGYRFHHYLLITFGFISGFVVGLFLSQFLPISSGESATYIQLGFGLVIGLLFAIFSTGFITFFLLALGGISALMALLPLYDQLPSPQDKIVILIGFGGGAILALILKRAIIIISTSILGSYAISAALFSLGLNNKYLTSLNMPYFLASWAAITAIAMAFQFVYSPKPEKSEPL